MRNVVHHPSKLAAARHVYQDNFNDWDFQDCSIACSFGFYTSRTVAWVVGNTATKRLSRNAWKNETDGSRLSKGEEIIRK